MAEKQAAGSSKRKIVLGLVLGILVLGIAGYVFLVMPRQSLSWQEQVEMATREAQNRAEDAVLVDLIAFIPSDFPDNQFFAPRFTFLTPEGQFITVDLSRSYTMILPVVYESPFNRGTAVAGMGVDWFREAIDRMQVEPTEATVIAQTALEEVYTGEIDPLAAFLNTTNDSAILQEHETRTIWIVNVSVQAPDDETTTAVFVTVNAETGEVLEINEEEEE